MCVCVCVCVCAFDGLNNKLYKMHGTHNKKITADAMTFGQGMKTAEFPLLISHKKFWVTHYRL